MKLDFILTVTRRQGSLTFAMKKRPTSGHVTYIRTLRSDVDVITSDFTCVLEIVVCSLSPLFFMLKKTYNKEKNIYIFASFSLISLEYYLFYVIIQIHFNDFLGLI